MPSHCCAFAYGITCNIFSHLCQKTPTSFSQDQTWMVFSCNIFTSPPSSEVWISIALYPWQSHAMGTLVLFYCSGSSGTQGPCPFHPCVVPNIWHAYSGHLMNADRKAVWSNGAWVLESEGQVVEFSSITDEWCGQSEPNSASVKWAYFLSCGWYREGDRCCKYPMIYTHIHTHMKW